MPNTDMKTVIADCFLAMSKEKNIDKITIKDIVDACNISRQAFYYHFHDIIEVIEWSAQQRFEQVLSLSLEAEDPEDAIRVFLSFAVESGPILKKLMHSQKKEYLEQMLLKGVRTYIQEMIRHKAPAAVWNYSKAEITIQFLTYGLAGILLDVSVKREVDIDDLSSQLYQLLKGPHPLNDD